MSEVNDFIIDFDEETLKNLSKILADTYIDIIQKEPEVVEEVFESPEAIYPVISEPIVLDLVASSMAGVTDILGQIRDFITSILNAIASGIVSAITTWIDQYIKPAISGVASLTLSLLEAYLKEPTSFISRFFLEQFLGRILKGVSDLILPLLSSAVSTLQSWFKSIWDSLYSYIQTNIAPFLSNIYSYLTQVAVPALSSLFSSAVSGLASLIQGAVSGIISGFETFKSVMSRLFQDLLTTVISSFTALGDYIRPIVPIVSSLPAFFKPIFSSLNEVISGLQSLVSLISAGFSSVANAFMGFMNALLNFPAWFPSWFNEYISKPISEAIGKLAKWFWDLMPQFMRDFITKSKEFFDILGKFLLDYLRDPIKAITDYIIKPLSDFVGNLPFVKDYVVPFIKGLKEGFDELIKDPSAWFTKHILQPIDDFINSQPLLRDYVIPFLKTLAEFYITFTKNPLEALSKYIFTPAKEWFVNLPFIKDYIAPFVTKIIDEFKKFIADPIGYIKEVAGNLWSAILDVGSKLLDAIKGAFEKLSEGFVSFTLGVFDVLKNITVKHSKNIFDILFDAIKDSITSIVGTFIDIEMTVLSFLAGLVEKSVKSVVDLVWGVAESVGKVITSSVEKVSKPIFDNLGSELEKKIAPYVEKLKQGWTPEGEIGEMISQLVTPYFIILAHSLALEGVYMSFHWIGNHLPDKDIEISFNALLRILGRLGLAVSPVGVGGNASGGGGGGAGVRGSIRIHINPKHFIRMLAGELKKVPSAYIRSIWQAYAYWMTEPFMRYSRALYRNFIPVEFPSLELLSEVLRRRMDVDPKTLVPSEDFAKLLEDAKALLRLYGYNDKIIDWLTKTDEAFTVKDRFGQDRNIPLALIYELPSPSDVAEMYVKDIFPNPEDFFRLFEARGMPKSVGALYYYLRFKYPPPERLWQFVIRGISGMLWASITKDVMDDIQKEIQSVGGYSPKSAVELNFDYPNLFKALQTYMKWYDYSRFAWVQNFTSDNQIMIDTLADIPTKIDQRWMVRFGLYEFLSQKGVKRGSPVSDFRTKIIENNATSNIQMHLQNFCRTLQATGLHPDYVPLTAVAEAIMSVGDERNLVRAGALNIFKEGFWNMDALSKLFSGALAVSFQVSSFDTTKLDWDDDKWVNVPLIFLPAEASLIQLRASMDRVVDILRELVRDVSNAYSDNIIEKYESEGGSKEVTFKNILETMIGELNEVFKADYKEITGTDLPAEMSLKYVEKYFKPLAKTLEISRTIYITRRIRSWTQRWIGWIMYRLATGVTTKEDFRKLVDVVSKYAKLTDYEKEFISTVMEFMGEIAVREYIPAPSQLATMSELVVIPDALVDKVLEARKVPDEWKPIWKNYIKVRPLADDIRGLLTAYRRALVYMAVPKELEAKVLGYASMINFTAQEMDVLKTRVELEEAIMNSREYIPSMLTLASMSEYVPEVRDFFDAVVKAKRIPKEWIPIWQKYIDIRPLVNDVRRYFSNAEQLYVRFMIKKDVFMKILDEVANYLGYTKKEVEFLLKTTEYERYRNAWTELVGSVERLVSLSEYSPTASNFALGKLYEMIDALPIDDATKNNLKKMWQEYIKNRPVRRAVSSYITSLISAYADGTISLDLLKSELNSLKEWGLTDNEIQFYIAKAEIYRAKKLKVFIG